MCVFQIMEKAELLRDAEANLLPALLRLQELVRKCSMLFLGLLLAKALCCCTVDDEGKGKASCVRSVLELSVKSSFITLLKKKNANHSLHFN